MKTEQRLKELGIELTKPTSPMANYVNAVRTGNLLYLAGKGPGLPGHPHARVVELAHPGFELPPDHARGRGSRIERAPDHRPSELHKGCAHRIGYLPPERSVVNHQQSSNTEVVEKERGGGGALDVVSGCGPDVVDALRSCRT